MEQDKTALLLEVAGFLNLIVQGYSVPNLKVQASELLEKIGKAVANDAGHGRED